MSGFCEPAQSRSMPQSSGRHSIAPTPEIPSTTNKAGVWATILPIASIGCPVPVEVSLRVPITQAASGCCSSALGHLLRVDRLAPLGVEHDRVDTEGLRRCRPNVRRSARH